MPLECERVHLQLKFLVLTSLNRSAHFFSNVLVGHLAFLLHTQEKVEKCAFLSRGFRPLLEAERFSSLGDHLQATNDD